MLNQILGHIVIEACEVTILQDLRHEESDFGLVGFGLRQIGDLGRAVYLRVPGCPKPLERSDDIPVLDDLVVLVGVEEIHRHPFLLTIV